MGEEQEQSPPDGSEETEPPGRSSVAVFPDEHTIFEHEKYNFEALELLINTKYKLLICIKCAYALTLGTAESHIRQHNLLPISSDMIDDLEQEFGLLSPIELDFPRDRPAPIFGLAFTSHEFHFCGGCGHGFAEHHTLQVHAAKCREPASNSHVGRAQQFSTSRYNSYFEVDISKMPPPPHAAPPDLFALFQQLDHAPPDYENLPNTGGHDDIMDANAFTRRERWDRLTEGLTPAEVADCSRTSAKEDNELHVLLRPVVAAYIPDVQPLIATHSAFGLQKRFAQYGP
jgi:hypothetical protein